MDLREPFRVFLRHRILTSVLLLLTLILTAASTVILPASYKASATVTLLNSPTSSQAIADGNPYLSFDPSLVEAANVLVIEITNEQNTAALNLQGDTASFQAVVLSENPENEEPFIQVSVSGGNADNVEQTLHGVIAQLGSLLNQLQASMAPKNRASIQAMAEDSQPSRSSGSKIKPLVGLFGIGLVLTFIIPQAVDGIAVRRRSRRRAILAPDLEPTEVPGMESTVADVGPEMETHAT